MVSAELPDPERPLRIGTRGSPLALAQATEARDRLMAAHGLPAAAFEIVAIRTTGDQVQDRPLRVLGGKGLFTREIEQALAEGRVDIAVHSMKDMPTLQPGGLAITACLPREDVRDAFVSPVAGTLRRPGGGERRRDVQRAAARRSSGIAGRISQVVEFRGSVETRLRKLGEGVAAATFLAMAGLKRLGLDAVPRVPIDPEEMLPAVAQGAIGIEQRSDDARVAALLAPIHDAATGVRMAAERAFLAGLDGSCQTPIAGLAELDGGRLRFRGEILLPRRVGVPAARG